MINIDDYDATDQEKDELKELRLRLSKLGTEDQVRYLSGLLCQTFYTVDCMIYIRRVLVELLISHDIKINGEYLVNTHEISK